MENNPNPPNPSSPSTAGGLNVPSSPPAPQVINLGAPSSQKPASDGHRILLLSIVSVVVLAVLAVGLVFGVNLVQKRQSQDIRSKAASNCSMRWPADPATSCGQSTQKPAQNATGIGLTPDFHWDYEDCVSPSGCSAYAASIYLTEGSASNSPFARCDVSGSAVLKDCPFSSFKLCSGDADCHTEGQAALTTLKPETDYYWSATPYFDGTVHAEQKWVYHFKTGPTTSVTPVAACQMVSADKDLTTIKTGDVVNFTGYGSLSSGSDADSIDKIEFTITKDGVAQNIPNPIVNTVRAPEKDQGTVKFWKATKSFPVALAGSYSVKIRVHWTGPNNTDIWKE